MKNRVYLILAGLCLGVGMEANAQLLDRTIDRAVNRAETRTTSKVNQKINSTVDQKVDKGVDKVLNPKLGTNGKTSNGSGSAPLTDRSGGSSSGSSSSSGTKTSPSSSGSNGNVSGASSTSAGGSNSVTGALNADISSFVGSFQWEVKRYKADKMVAGGHSLLNFYVKPYETAIHVLNPSTEAKEMAYILKRGEKKVITIKESEGTATKSDPKTLPVSKMDLKRTLESQKVDGIICAKYVGSIGDLVVTAFIDESQQVDMLGSISTGIGVSRADLDFIPHLVAMKAPVREAVIEDKKKGEKTRLWLSDLKKDTPEEKYFDASRYEQR